MNSFALVATCVAGAAIVLSSSIVVAHRDGSAGEGRALAHELVARSDPAREAFEAGIVAAGSGAGADSAAVGRRIAFGSADLPRLDRQHDLAHLTPEDQAKVDKLVKKLDKYTHMMDVAEGKLAGFQAEFDDAQQALLDALAMPDRTAAELKAKNAAIKAANARIAKFGKKLAKWTNKLDNYAGIVAEVQEEILAIDPGYFPGEGPQAWAPDAPEDLNATGGSDFVRLTWTPVDGATAYDVFWSQSASVSPDSGTMIPAVSSPYIHAGLNKGEHYFYVVTAVNDEGMSEPSEVAGAMVQAAVTANTNSPLGMNFLELTYYSPEWVFTDAMRQSMPWVPQQADSSAWDTGYSLHLDSNGWPILGTNPSGHPEAAGTSIYRSLGGHYPAGQYVCLYDGEGSIEFSFDAHTVSATPGRIVVNVSPTDDGIYLKITASNPNNRIRNVRLKLPGFENSSEIFHPLFLQRLAPFRVLRFMDWQRTNASPNKNWSERNTTLTPSQDDKRGVALEYMIELCNELGTDPWFCIPHLATDDYVTQFATMVRDRLDPNLRVYIEHSNEIWNGTFGGTNGQYTYCIEKGQALGLDPGNQWVAGLRYHSQQSVHIFNIFESVFGGTSRLVRVLATQSANPWAGVQVMDWQNAHQHADALAVAPYFGYDLDDDTNVPNMSIQQILDYLAHDISAVQNPLCAQNHGNAQQRGLRLVAYEAGQHLTAVGDNVGNGAVTSKFIAVNKDPGMYVLYQQSLAGWEQAGGEMACMFAGWSTYSQWGSWGAMEKMDQDPGTSSSPKYSALVDFVAQHQ